MVDGNKFSVYKKLVRVKQILGKEEYPTDMHLSSGFRQKTHKKRILQSTTFTLKIPRKRRRKTLVSKLWNYSTKTLI